MKYCELKKTLNEWDGKVCFFGAGLIGRTWAYDLMEAMGFYPDFYCDNNKRENVIIRDEVKTISPEELYSFKDKVLVFITTTDKNHQIIREQLQENGIVHIENMGYYFMQTFIESLEEEKKKDLKERFKCIVDDAEYISRQFEYHMGYRPNLDDPQTFNEKLQWLKLYDRNPAYTQMVDKYKAKKYVADRIGEEYIIPALGIWDKFDSIDFDALPEQFVLKCTHDSGSAVVCKNRNEFNKHRVKNLLESCLKRNYYYSGREYPYKNVNPAIMAEKYLEDTRDGELRDYKLFTFDGRVKVLCVVINRFAEHGKPKFDWFDMEFNHLDLVRGYPNADIVPHKPEKLELMCNLAEKLSEGIRHLRVDFYEADGKIFFGEMTFYPGCGWRPFEPEMWDYKLGKWIKLPKSCRKTG